MEYGIMFFGVPVWKIFQECFEGIHSNYASLGLTKQVLALTQEVIS